MMRIATGLMGLVGRRVTPVVEPPEMQPLEKIVLPAVIPLEIEPSADVPLRSILEVRNLNAYYEKNHVLKNISLNIPRGEVTALIGPSGCGKSTFLRMFNRMNVEMDKEGTFRHTGNINLIDGEGAVLDIHGVDVDPTFLRREIGMVFQKPNPFPQTVYNNVAYIPSLDGIRGRELDEIVETSLKRAGLWDEVKDDLKKKYGTELSGGQQQRLCIARALASDPDVLLLDEPCSALDPISTNKIESLIQELSDNGVTVIIVTHNMKQAARVADDGMTAFFYLGELIEFGSTDDIFERPKNKQTEDYVRGRFG